MAGSINKAMIMGNLGKDPEIRNTKDGKKVATLSIATSESWKDKDGKKQEKTEWHKVVVFNQGICSLCEQYLCKGAKVLIEGAITTRKWTDDKGIDRYTTEIVLANFNGNLTIVDFGGDGERKSKTQDKDSWNSTPQDDDFGDTIPF